METIINQITASQGLSAVAVLALFNLLFIIFYAFIIGKVFDRIKDLQVNNHDDRVCIDTCFETFNSQLELLKKSHSELNQTFARERRADFQQMIILDEKIDTLQQTSHQRMVEFEKQILESIEAGKARELKTRIQIENFNKKISQILSEKAENKTTSLEPKKQTKPKFIVGDRLKTNKGNFYGVVIQRLVENNKYIYLVKNKLMKKQRWYSETTLRKS